MTMLGMTNKKKTAMGGIGTVADSLGLTNRARESLASTTEGAMDAIGERMMNVVDDIDSQLDSTADDLSKKGHHDSVDIDAERQI